MKIQSLQNNNITVLFSAPLNHLLISQDKLSKIFDTSDPQQNIRNFVEAPGLKLMIFPTQKKDIAFEPARLVVSDKSGVDIEKSALINDFRKVFNSDAIDPTKVAAYGFNYDVLVEMDRGSLGDIVGQKLSNLPNVKNGGAMVSFEKEGINYVLEIKPAKDKIFLAHLNAHISSNKIPDDLILRSELASNFKIFIDILKTI